MPSIKSPWESRFNEFVGSIQESAIIAAPFISREPVERLVHHLDSRRSSVRLDLLTSLNERSLSEGSVDSAALSWMCGQVPGATVRHLRNLHAKAYVADTHTAIITSANLTRGGLSRNYELGFAVTDPEEVAGISDDLREYAGFGVLVPADALTELDDMARRARDYKKISDASSSDDAKSDYDIALHNINERLVELRTSAEEFKVDPEASINAKFAAAVVYVLRHHGPLKTTIINDHVQELMPELCDDNVDRIINGVSFGKKWKHQVRNAQLQLNRSGVIVLEGGLWRLL